MSQATIALPCAECGGRMEVKDSRSAHWRNQPAVRRRRHCRKCGWRATTFEVLETSLPGNDVRVGRILLALRKAHDAIGWLLDEFDNGVSGKSASLSVQADAGEPGTGGASG